MKTLRFFGLMIVAVMLSFNFSSCSSDDDDDATGGSSSNAGSVVIPEVPDEGWSGNMKDGIATYCPEGQYVDEESGLNGSCYAYEFSNGICMSSAYNVICSSDYYAKVYAELLNSGAWADFGEDYEDDEDYYYMPEQRTMGIINYNTLSFIKKQFASLLSTRAGNSALSFNVKRKGNVIYIELDNFVGRSAADVKYAVDVWNGNVTIPNRFVFGSWDAKKGVYECRNLHGMDIDYRVDIKFDSERYVRSYITTMTFPTAEWAQIMYDSLLESQYDMIEQFGAAPDVTISGKVIRVDAVIVDDVPEDYIVSYLMLMDYANNVPLIASVFE